MAVKGRVEAMLTSLKDPILQRTLDRLLLTSVDGHGWSSCRDTDRDNPYRMPEGNNGRGSGRPPTTDCLQEPRGKSLETVQQLDSSLARGWRTSVPQPAGRPAGRVEQRCCWRTNRSASVRVAAPDLSMVLRVCRVLARTGTGWRIRCRPFMNVAISRRSTNSQGARLCDIGRPGLLPAPSNSLPCRLRRPERSARGSSRRVQATSRRCIRDPSASSFRIPACPGRG